jgi:MFS family permease
MFQIELGPVCVLAETATAYDAVLASDQALSQTAPLPTEESSLFRTRTCPIVVTVAGISFLNTHGSGLLTVCLPRIATDLDLAPNLLWPPSVYALTMGCSLLLVGTVADVVGNRPIFLTGCVLLPAFTLGCSLARTAVELIAFRALQAIAMAFCMPTAVGLITANFLTGRGRNITFTCLEGGSPVRFALRLVLGVLLVNSIRWRYGYYLSCELNEIFFYAVFFPQFQHPHRLGLGWKGCGRILNGLESPLPVPASRCFPTSSP